MKNNSIDKMAEQFTSPEELKAYSEAQYKTILKLNEEINKLKENVAVLETENRQLRMANAKEKGEDFGAVSDEEAACVTQISLIKGNAMTRELTMDEAKRLEIYVKTLQLIRNKEEPAKNKAEKDAGKLSTEDLLKQADQILKS